MAQIFYAARLRSPANGAKLSINQSSLGSF
jgi:hypothetical protein